MTRRGWRTRKNGNVCATHSYHVHNTAKERRHKYKQKKTNSAMMRFPTRKLFLAKTLRQVKVQSSQKALTHTRSLLMRQNLISLARLNLPRSRRKR